MSVALEYTRSLWMDTPVAIDAPRLRQDEKAGIVVIGAGIAGLSVAYELVKRGEDVVVIDRGGIGMGMTSRTTAHLSSISDDWYAEFIDMRGLEAARQFHRSQSAAISRIEEIQRDEKIACNFRRVDGMLFPHLDDTRRKIDAELEAALRIGIEGSEVRGLPFEGHSDVPALRYPGQATFNPMLYIAGLAAAISAHGGRLYAETIAETAEEADERVTVRTFDGKTISARAAVFATNSPINDRFAIHTKQAPYRTYAIALEMPRGMIADALYWDTLDPYHYVRLEPGRGDADVLIVGGEDHKTGEANDGEERFARLEDWTHRMLPQAGPVTHRWSGQVMEPIDYAGFIGRNPGNRNIYVATGDSGQGMTHGALAGLLIADLVMKGASPWQELYEPSRKTLSAARDFISENATAFKNFAEYVAPGELSSATELERGEGAIIRKGLSKIAAYRDEDGRLYQRSAMCTHTGCHVHWNALERCWDCPCHGSQFAPDGTALNGPAIHPLPPAK
jgi:glycine/D-amino acid oxidase-like deaminating enzyme